MGVASPPGAALPPPINNYIPLQELEGMGAGKTEQTRNIVHLPTNPIIHPEQNWAPRQKARTFPVSLFPG